MGLVLTEIPLAHGFPIVENFETVYMTDWPVIEDFEYCLFTETFGDFPITDSFERWLLVEDFDHIDDMWPVVESFESEIFVESFEFSGIFPDWPFAEDFEYPDELDWDSGDDPAVEEDFEPGDNWQDAALSSLILEDLESDWSPEPLSGTVEENFDVDW